MAADEVKVVTDAVMALPAVNDVPAKFMPPVLVTTGAKPAAEAGPVIETVLPDAVAEKPFAVITAARRLATVPVLLLEEVEPLVIVTPFTFTLVTDVLPLPETVMVAVAFAGVMVTTGWNPEAELGPVIVTTLPEEVALKLPTLILPSTLVAIVVELLVAAVAPLMICVPFTVMPVTIELLPPEKVTLAVGSGGVVVMTGVTPATDPGPLIVTVLPEAVAL